MKFITAKGPKPRPIAQTSDGKCRVMSFTDGEWEFEASELAAGGNSVEFDISFSDDERETLEIPSRASWWCEGGIVYTRMVYTFPMMRGVGGTGHLLIG